MWKKKVPEPEMTPTQKIRSSIRTLDSASKKLHREMSRVDNEIRAKAAKGCRKSELTILCQRRMSFQKSISRMEAAINKLHLVEDKIREAETNKIIGTAMAGASATMGAMNKEMDSSGVMKTAAEYQRQQAKNEMVTQMMDDTLNTDISVEEEADEEVNKILMQVAGVRLDGMSLVPNQQRI
ncbi:hypothetical protein WA171_005235 [Blastocystis sp. BT1]